MHNTNHSSIRSSSQDRWQNCMSGCIPCTTRPTWQTFINTRMQKKKDMKKYRLDIDWRINYAWFYDNTTPKFSAASTKASQWNRPHTSVTQLTFLYCISVRLVLILSSPFAQVSFVVSSLQVYGAKRISASQEGLSSMYLRNRTK